MEDINIDKLFREKINLLSGVPENISWNEDAGWMQYRSQFHSEKVWQKRFIISIMSAAALLAIVLFTVINNPFSGSKTIINQNITAVVSRINLPDGNIAWLNSNSSIMYSTGVKSGNFEIIVSGEVYFEINNLNYKKITLKAFNATIIAEKAASINIKAYPGKENVDINVKTGAIKVFEGGSPNGLALLITQGNYCSVHKSQKLIYTSKNFNENYLAWKTGKLIFEDQPIATVVDILSEYYNRPIEIVSESIAYCTFSGCFERPSIENILDKIQKDLDLKVKYTGTKITISGKGCL